MKRWTVSLAIVFILFLSHSPVFSNPPDVLIHGDNAIAFGGSVASAGDFNGDGIEDIIVGASQATSNGLEFAGKVFIFFGRNTTTTTDLSALADADVIIEGQNNSDQVGNPVASAGDFNGDGFGDVIIGATGRNSGGTANSGSALIFFGRSPANQLFLNAETDANIILEGQSAFGWFGNSVASAGDFNGDGLGDVIVGAAFDTTNGVPNSGNAFIFFGQNPSSQLVLNANTDSNVILDGRIPYDSFGRSVASAGDFNGDGLSDVAVGAYADGNQAGEQSGAAFIFFGQNPSGQINLSAGLDSNIILDGQNTWDGFGFSVASAGDFNGDGLSDVIVGAGLDDNNGIIDSGSAFIFFGQNPASQLILQADADANIILDGQSPGDRFAGAVASTGDFNADGLDDVIISATWDDNNGLAESGSAYLFFGRNSTTQIMLRADADADVIFEGQEAGDFFGESVATAGDFNGDGIDDAIVGAPFATVEGSIFLGHDPDAPILTVLGDNPVLVESGTVYSDAGATATDVEDGDITASIGVSGLPIDTSILGTYTVIYQVTDSSSNSAQAVRTVKVVDTTPPIVAAPANVTVEATGTTTEATIGTATATDNVAVVSITHDAPAAFPLGTTIVTWTATDTSGNTGTATQNVSVQDTTAPALTINGFNPVTVQVGATYTDAGATAMDIVDGDLTSSIVVLGLPVDTSVIGSHIITYDITDSSGNSTHAERTVHVIDATPPVITSPADVTVDQTGDLTPVPIGTATATDNVAVASIINDAPASFPVGTTVVTWTATDTSGNSSSATQQVTVNPVPLVQVQLLRNLVNSLSLPSNLNGNLNRKLDRAENAIQNGNHTRAINKLNAFITKVQEMTPQPISASDADEMIQRAQAIIALL